MNIQALVQVRPEDTDQCQARNPPSNKKLGIRSEELGIKKIMVSYSDFLTKIYSSFLLPHSSFELPAALALCRLKVQQLPFQKSK